MKLHSIEFKNFASYGNRVQKIDFEDVGNLYLVLGENGAGKCLAKDTSIKVSIDDPVLRNQFLEFIKNKKECKIEVHKYFKPDSKTECNIGDLYEFNMLNNSVSDGAFEVCTRHGKKKVLGVDITAYDSIQHKLTTDTGKTIASSPDHLFFFNDWKKAKLFKVGDCIETEDGIEHIVENKIIDGTADLYDIEVDEVKEFYANRFVSHNSSLAKVITYLCYGKTEGANIKDLPNRVNGSMWGRVIMTCKNNRVEIERGVSPSIFTVKVNDVEYDVAGKTNLQDFLETEIFDIPYHVFKNVIILSVNDFKSFITMSTSDKKQIVDRIFGFSAINEMKELVKNKRKLIVEDIKVFEEEIKTLTDSIESVKLKLDEFEKATNDKNTAEIKTLKTRLFELNENKKKLVTANERVRSMIVSSTEEAKRKVQKQQDIKNDIASHNRALKLYENNSCPTCNASLESEFHEKEEDKHKCAIATLGTNQETIKAEVLIAEENLQTARDNNRKIITRAAQLDTQMEQIKTELIKISENKGQNSIHLRDLIDDFDVKKESSLSGKTSIEGKNYYLSLLETIVGEDGIKNLAVKSILPSLNNHVMLMGKEMGIPFGVVFDEKFNCVLYHLGEEINPKTLSTGEKKKADFVIIMALIKMIKTRFPGLNILFLDEIFSSIDSSGIYHIINILHQTIKEAKINTFVINHTVLPSEYFDKRLEISKDSGFSEFTVEDIG